MDIQQIEALKQRYSGMSDDELAYVVVTYEGKLTDEANIALTGVVRSRNPEKFEAAVRAVRADVRQQNDVAIEKQKTQRKAQLQARTVLRVFAGALIVLGLIVAVFSDGTKGALIAFAGFGSLIYYELKQLFWKFVTALFRNE